MKRTYSALALAALILAALASCKKNDDDNKPTTSQTPTPPPTGSPNPLTSKICHGIGLLTVDGAQDSVQCGEVLFEPMKIFAIFASGQTHSLSMTSGLKKLPPVNTVFTIQGDYSKLPAANEMVLNYYDEEADADYYALSGTVSYTISNTAKTAKFSAIEFKSDQGDTKVISFEVKLK